MSSSDNSPEAITTSNKLLCVLLFSGILILYAGRTSVSVVLVELQMPTDNSTSTNLSKPLVQYSQFQVGVILSSVYAGLLPSGFVGGYLAYRYSAMRVVLASVGISSIIHSVAPVMFQRFETAVTQRVFAGLSEGLCEPAVYGALNEYMLPKKSARVAPFIFAGIYIGQFVGLISTGFISERLVWKATFYIFGCLGIAWTVVTVGFKLAASKEEVMDTSKPDKGKRTKTKSIPFRHILTSPAVWAFILLQVAAYVWDPNLLPLYFNQSFGTKIELTGVLAGVPILIFGAIEPLFALLGNLLCKYVSTTVARKVMAVTACLCVSGCLFTAAFTSNPIVAACFVAVGFGCSAARAAVADCNLFDIVPRYVSVIEGICRVTCRIVGLTFPLLATALTPHKTLQEWSRVVLIKACVFAATGLIFLVFGSGEEQSWAAVPSQGHDGDDIQQSGSTKKLNDEKIPLVVK